MAERFKKEMGYLVEVPIYEGHKRGRNWLAVISPDPKSPGGLARSFCEHGRGKYFYNVEDLKPGDVIEFGADYYTRSGHPSRNREYGVVISNVADYLEIEFFDTPAEAFQYAKENFREQEVVIDKALQNIETERLIAELRRRGYEVVEKPKEGTMKVLAQEEFNLLEIFDDAELIRELERRGIKVRKASKLLSLASLLIEAVEEIIEEYDPEKTTERRKRFQKAMHDLYDIIKEGYEWVEKKRQSYQHEWDKIVRSEEYYDFLERLTKAYNNALEFKDNEIIQRLLNDFLQLIYRLQYVPTKLPSL